MSTASTYPREPHDVPLTLRFKRSDYADLENVANQDHRRASDWARARVLEALKDSAVEIVETRA